MIFEKFDVHAFIIAKEKIITIKVQRLGHCYPIWNLSISEESNDKKLVSTFPTLLEKAILQHTISFFENQVYFCHAVFFWRNIHFIYFLLVRDI